MKCLYQATKFMSYKYRFLGYDLASVSNISTIWLWNCSDSVVCFYLSFFWQHLAVGFYVFHCHRNWFCLQRKVKCVFFVWLLFFWCQYDQIRSFISPYTNIYNNIIILPIYISSMGQKYLILLPVNLISSRFLMKSGFYRLCFAILFLYCMFCIWIIWNKNVDIKFNAHDTFLE